MTTAPFYNIDVLQVDDEAALFGFARSTTPQSCGRKMSWNPFWAHGPDGKLHRIKAEIKDILMENRDAELATEPTCSNKPGATRLFDILGGNILPM